MSIFVSNREKKYWVFSILVTMAILSTTLFIERPSQQMLVDHNFQVVLFVMGMVFTASTIFYYGIFQRSSKYEVVLWIGMATILLMLFFRLGAAERSHIMEFSVLAIFVHIAMKERNRLNKLPLNPSILAFLTTVLVGVVDESLQYFLPERVFDVYDIWFNVIAAGGAIGGMLLLRWVKKRLNL